MTKDYYKKHKDQWKKGGKYYYYKPKLSDGGFSINRGIFMVIFD